MIRLHTHAGEWGALLHTIFTWGHGLMGPLIPVTSSTAVQGEGAWSIRQSCSRFCTYFSQGELTGNIKLEGNKKGDPACPWKEENWRSQGTSVVTTPRFLEALRPPASAAPCPPGLLCDATAHTQGGFHTGCQTTAPLTSSLQVLSPWLSVNT